MGKWIAGQANTVFNAKSCTGGNRRGHPVSQATTRQNTTPQYEKESLTELLVDYGWLPIFSAARSSDNSLLVTTDQLIVDLSIVLALPLPRRRMRPIRQCATAMSFASPAGAVRPRCRQPPRLSTWPRVIKLRPAIGAGSAVGTNGRQTEDQRL